jgi:hypothetical protein
LHAKRPAAKHLSRRKAPDYATAKPPKTSKPYPNSRLSRQTSPPKPWFMIFTPFSAGLDFWSWFSAIKRICVLVQILRFAQDCSEVGAKVCTCGFLRQKFFQFRFLELVCLAKNFRTFTFYTKKLKKPLSPAGKLWESVLFPHFDRFFEATDSEGRQAASENGMRAKVYPTVPALFY